MFFNFDKNKLYIARPHFKQDKTLLLGSTETSAPTIFANHGYAYIANICCRECARKYIKENLSDSANFLILANEDLMFNGAELIFPMPILWKGNANEIIAVFNEMGFSIYHGNEDEAIMILPKYFKPF